MNQNVLSLRAALFAEKKEKNHFNKCDSLVTLVFKATDLKKVTVSSKTIRLEGNMFQILEQRSHRKWKDVFRCKNLGNILTIEVPEEYISDSPL